MFKYGKEFYGLNNKANYVIYPIPRRYNAGKMLQGPLT